MSLILRVASEQDSVSVGRDSQLFACVVYFAVLVEFEGWVELNRAFTEEFQDLVLRLASQ